MIDVQYALAYNTIYVGAVRNLWSRAETIPKLGLAYDTIVCLILSLKFVECGWVTMSKSRTRFCPTTVDCTLQGSAQSRVDHPRITPTVNCMWVELPSTITCTCVNCRTASISKTAVPTLDVPNHWYLRNMYHDRCTDFCSD